MRAEDKYIRFDWAIKRMLRDKANFDVLEGFISVFTGEKVKIECLLESEGNQDAYDDKFNRVDIKARNDKGEIIIIEVQLSREVHYLERILYGTAKSITEQLKVGQPYYDLKKVISISVVYFDLGIGTDYLYHGQVRLEGVHTHDILKVNEREKAGMALPDENTAKSNKMHDPSEVFPEYYLIRVENFNQYAKTPIEEWMEYLKNGIIKDDTEDPGLQAAKEKLQYLMMNDADRIAYERHMDAVRIQNDVIGNAKAEGLAEGRAEGLAEGLEKGRIEERKQSVTRMASRGLSVNDIADMLGLSAETVENILSKK